SFWTIVLGHATFFVVVVYNNAVARFLRTSGSLIEASMVQTENGMSNRLKAERSAMPVMLPGSAIGRMTSSEIASRQKNFVWLTAA
ncbi:hypothetical protein AB9F42_34885, partial [Rhizobium leguminosarum]